MEAPGAAFIPFTLEEAVDVCDDFEDLIDTEFSTGPGQLYLVDNVVISPFEISDKEQFISNYLETKNKSRALEFYAGDKYDVILFISDAEDNVNFTDIRTFALERGITYHFPGND